VGDDKRVVSAGVGASGAIGHPHGVLRPLSRLLIAAGAMILLVVVGIVVWSATGGTNAAHVTAPVDPPSPLQPPTDVFAGNSWTTAAGLIVSWHPSQPMPVGYRIYRAMGRYGVSQIIGSVDAPDMNTFTDSRGLVPDMTYVYTVTAFDRRGESAPSAPAVAVVLPPPPTPPPTATSTPLQPLPSFTVYPTPTPKAHRAGPSMPASAPNEDHLTPLPIDTVPRTAPQP